jgi:hypothetical protein
MGYAANLKVAGSTPDKMNEYQRQIKIFLWSRALPVREANNLTVICELIV